jgi:TPR repeat protein
MGPPARQLAGGGARVYVVLGLFRNPASADPIEAVGELLQVALGAVLGAAVFYGMGVPADTVEGYAWTRLAAEQGFPKAISNLPEMSGALTDEERKRAEKQVARFHPKGNDEKSPNYSRNRGNRATTRYPRTGVGGVGY